MLRHLHLVFALLVFAANPVQADDKSLGMVSGPKAGTYVAVGGDIARVAEKAGVKIEVKESGGSIDNIKRITSGENAALGIVQSDVLGFLSRSKNPDSIRVASNLRLVFPLYREEVHVLANQSIKSFSELKGKKVVIGEDGSGSMLTAINLFSVMGVVPEAMMKIAPAEGLVSVMRGEADAILFVGGKPVRMFKNLENILSGNNEEYKKLLSKLHFIALKDPLMLEEYSPAEIVPADYSFVKERIPTVAVTSALIAYDFSPSSRQSNKDRCEEVRKVADAIRTDLDSLKKDGHPKWKEVDLSTSVGSWKKDLCAWPAEKPPEKDANSLNRDLLDIVTQSGK